MTSEASIRSALNNLRIQEEQLRNELSIIRKNKTISCSYCSKKTKIKDIDLIIVMDYVEPYGCTGGDYWKFSEHNYNCPKCKMRNRLLDDSSYKVKYKDRSVHTANKYFFREYEDLFNSITEEHRRASVKFVNNQYICENLKKFLPKERVDELISHYDDQYVDVIKKVKLKNVA